MTAIALIFGLHMVLAIGGAYACCCSMLNSYSGWAAAATGFLLGNDLLIVTGALVGLWGDFVIYYVQSDEPKFYLCHIRRLGTTNGPRWKLKAR